MPVRGAQTGLPGRQLRRFEHERVSPRRHDIVGAADFAIQSYCTEVAGDVLRRKGASRMSVNALQLPGLGMSCQVAVTKACQATAVPTHHDNGRV